MTSESRQDGQSRDRDPPRVRRASKAIVQPANDPDPDRLDGQEAMAMTAATTCRTLPEALSMSQHEVDGSKAFP